MNQIDKLNIETTPHEASLTPTPPNESFIRRIERIYGVLEASLTYLFDPRSDDEIASEGESTDSRVYRVFHDLFDTLSSLNRLFYVVPLLLGVFSLIPLYLLAKLFGAVGVFLAVLLLFLIFHFTATFQLRQGFLNNLLSNIQHMASPEHSSSPSSPPASHPSPSSSSHHPHRAHRRKKTAVDSVEWLNDIVQKFWLTHADIILHDLLPVVHQNIDQAIDQVVQGPLRAIDAEFPLRNRLSVRLLDQTGRLSLGSWAPKIGYIRSESSELQRTIVFTVQTMFIANAQFHIDVAFDSAAHAQSVTPTCSSSDLNSASSSSLNNNSSSTSSLNHNNSSSTSSLNNNSTLTTVNNDITNTNNNNNNTSSSSSSSDVSPPSSTGRWLRLFKQWFANLSFHLPLISVLNPLFTAQLRIQLTLNPDQPQASEIDISLLEPPEFDLQLRVGRIDLFAFPFLRPFVTDAARAALQELLIYPYSVRYSNGALQLAARSQFEDLQPITHLRLYFPARAQEPLPSGWFVLSSTFPSRFPTRFGRCFVLFKRAPLSPSLRPITDVRLCYRAHRTNLPPDLLPHGYHWVEDDDSADNLRGGTPQAHLYQSLCYKRQTHPAERPVTAVALTKERFLGEQHPDWCALSRTVSSSQHCSLVAAPTDTHDPVFFAFRRDPAHVPDPDFCYEHPITDVAILLEIGGAVPSVPAGYFCVYRALAQGQPPDAPNFGNLTRKEQKGGFRRPWIIYSRDPQHGEPITALSYIHTLRAEDIDAEIPEVPPQFEILKLDVQSRRLALLDRLRTPPFIYLATDRSSSSSSSSSSSFQQPPLQPIADVIVYDPDLPLPPGWEPVDARRSLTLSASGAPSLIAQPASPQLRARKDALPALGIAVRRVPADFIPSALLQDAAASPRDTPGDSFASSSSTGHLLSSSSSSAAVLRSKNLYAHPVTDIAVLFYDRGHQLPHRDWETIRETVDGKDKTHLNKGSGGVKVRIALSRNTVLAPIVDVGILHTGLEKLAPGWDEIRQTGIQGFPDKDRIDANLNSGAKVGLLHHKKSTHNLHICFRRAADASAWTGEEIVDIGMCYRDSQSSSLLPPGWELVSASVTGAFSGSTNETAKEGRGIYLCILRAKNVPQFVRPSDETPISALFVVTPQHERQSTWFEHNRAIICHRTIGARYANLTPPLSDAPSQYLAYCKSDAGPIYDIVFHTTPQFHPEYQPVTSSTQPNKPINLTELRPNHVPPLYIHVSKVPRFPGQKPIVDVEFQLGKQDPSLPESYQPVCDKSAPFDIHINSTLSCLILYTRRAESQPSSRRHLSYFQASSN